MYELEVVNPVAPITRVRVQPAPRLKDLAGATVALFWNFKPGGDVALATVADILRERYPGVDFRDYTGSVGSSVRYATPSDRAKIVTECDAVIGAVADCGSCTSWLIHDMVQFEKAGLPTVAVTARHFEKDARISGDIAGLPDVPLMLVDAALSNQRADNVRSMATSAIDDVERGLTVAIEASEFTDPAGATSELETETFAGTKPDDSLDTFNRAYLEREWSDGLPLIPPTPERVEAMIAAVDAGPDDVVVPALYPGLGIATVGKIAVNGVMAGCRPEHMPVLIAMVKAYEATGIMGKTQAISTGPNAPLVLISGPVVSRLGFNYGTCVSGPGAISHVNTVVGRALRLILMNIGYAYPGRFDMDTIGTPNKYSWCLAENVQANPWDAWNVGHGFDQKTSTVSIALVYPGPDVLTFTADDPKGFLDAIASLTSNYLGTASIGRWLYGGRTDPETGQGISEKNVVLLAPDHARLFAEAGWSRQDARQYLYEASRMPYASIGSAHFTPENRIAALHKARPELSWIVDQPDVKVATAESPECYEFFVVGGEAGRSQYLFGGSDVVTVAIDEKN